MGGRTQRYAVHIFRLAVADRLRALRGGAFDQALRMDRHHARAGTNGQTNAGDVAFRHVAARLLAVAEISESEIRNQKSEISNQWSVVRSLVVEKIPLFALVAASAVVTSVAQSHGGAVRTFTEAPIALRLSNALVSYAKYVLLAFWPNDLAVFYPFPGTGIPAWQIIGAALLLIGITAFCFFQRKVRPYLIVGWLWFLGTLVPVIGLVQVGGQTMADRYFYIPSIGLFIALVFGLADIAERRRVAPWLSAAIANVVLLVLATLTNAQIHRWSDSFTLFKHALAVTPPNVAIEDCLGFAMHRSGQLDEAAAHFEKALQLTPDDHMALLTMGVSRFYQGRVPEAIEYAQAAIRLQPDAPKAHDLLGMSLAMQNQNEAALDEVRRASELAPERRRHSERSWTGAGAAGQNSGGY